MLDFFRKYQKYIYLVITVVVIISFSFFGTYSTIVSHPMRDQVVFTAIDGSPIRRSELDEMVMFISTDTEDKKLSGGAWGPNFLNDGVIKKDILATGIGEILAMNYMGDLESDLQTRLAREKKYRLYTHPQAKFINVIGAWKYFAPPMIESYSALKAAQSPLDPEAFAARIQLFLNEKQFPAPLLRQVLTYQEKQQSWISHDPELDYTDPFWLFGYRTIDDWFGPRYVRLVSQFIINAAKIAEEKGYAVSKEEALADLLRNAQLSYQQNLNNPHLGVANSTEYYNEQLRRLGMDQSQAVKIWRDVLLFRRLFDDVGNSVLTDAMMYQKFNDYANQSVSGTLYQLPKELQIADWKTLQKFEIYLSAVSKRSDEEKNSLAIPTSFLSAAEVSKKYPELVQKKYLLQISEANKDALQAKVALKETWNWEVQDTNWEKLKKEFPELAIKKGDNRDERFTALDSLDDMTRTRVDTFARAEIVNENPKWIEEAQEKAKERTMVVGLSSKGNNTLFDGLDDGEALIKELDKATLKGQEGAAPINFSADNRHYYRILVIDRAPKQEVLSFAEANKAGILDRLLTRELKSYYSKIRDANAADYKAEDGSWKPLDEVSNKVADQYFAKVLKAIEEDYLAASGEKQENMNSSMLAPLRFYAYMREMESKLKADPSVEASLTATPAEESLEMKVPASKPLEQQFKLVKQDSKIQRSAQPDNKEAFALAAGSWTQVITLPNGDLSFFHVAAKGNANALASAEKLDEVHSLVSSDAQRNYMRKVVAELKASKALSLDYLNQPIETLEPEDVAPMPSAT